MSIESKQIHNLEGQLEASGRVQRSCMIQLDKCREENIQLAVKVGQLKELLYAWSACYDDCIEPDKDMRDDTAAILEEVDR